MCTTCSMIRVTTIFMVSNEQDSAKFPNGLDAGVGLQDKSIWMYAIMKIDHEKFYIAQLFCGLPLIVNITNLEFISTHTHNIFIISLHKHFHYPCICTYFALIWIFRERLFLLNLISENINLELVRILYYLVIWWQFYI